MGGQKKGRLGYLLAQLLLYGVTSGCCVLSPKVIAPWEPPSPHWLSLTLGPSLTLGLGVVTAQGHHCNTVGSLHPDHSLYSTL